MKPKISTGALFRNQYRTKPTSADGKKYLTVTIQEFRPAGKKSTEKEPDFLCD